ncbi:helix-turn-helix transcriptional regulator [Paenibacillus cisolokensis]|uniref:helix-turn-helix domain-containing protein n=1 Tax=Paenibacillus cisolokensis TaxID=1658519 RepID=UPI003D2B1D58
MVSIGSRITKLREEKGLTRYRLAIKSGISFSYMSAIEEGKHSPSLDVVEKVASGLGIKLSELFQENEIREGGEHE